jgi:hypothetical protein
MQHSRTEEVAARTGGRADYKLRYQLCFCHTVSYVCGQQVLLATGSLRL